MIWQLQHLMDYCNTEGVTTSSDGKTWVPARPMSFSSVRYRLKMTWLVLTGKADVVIWPEGQ